MYTYSASLSHVVDGDTADLLCDLGFSVKINIRFRLARINTPERGEEGYGEAKQALLDFLLASSHIVVKCKGKDKYGRWIAEIEGDKCNVNDYLLTHGFALPYEK